MTCFSLLAAAVVIGAVQDDGSFQEIHLSAGDAIPALKAPSVVNVDADRNRGFNHPYLLFVPDSVDQSAPVRLLVEPNNTGSATDDFHVHRDAAHRLATRSYPRRLAQQLGSPLLVPVFPRPRSDWRIYTHALDRDSMLVEDGDLARIDLQLLAMIDHARALLKGAAMEIEPRVFMHGYSASGTFVNRFAALHPTRVQAVASGGVNGLPILPLSELEQRALPYPIGVTDLEPLTGAAFDVDAYRRVGQFIYMGFLDRNDTFPYGDAWNDDERAIIATVLGEEMMPDRWERCQAVMRPMELPIQFVTYNGTHHEIKPEMIEDIVAFFRANNGDEPARIEPHEYEFVPFREITTAHVDAVLWPGDERLPSSQRSLDPDSTFVMSIAEWIDGQGHQQLSRFARNAGFEFEIRDGDADVMRITESNLNGTSSFSDGTYHVFKVRLDDEQLALLKPGVQYSVVPINGHDAYRWVVNPGAILVRPK